jgi:DNA mismatch repair protein MutS
MSTTDTKSSKQDGIISSGTETREWDIYFNLYKKIRSDYAKKGYPNKKFAVLYQIGPFWEVYGVDNEVEQIGNIRDILKISNLNLTQKNNSKDYNPHNDPLINDKDHPLFGGCPIANKEEQQKRLIEAGYDIYYYRQEQQTDENSKKKKVRVFDELVTPSTYIGELVASDSSHLVSIYIHNITLPSERLFKWQDIKLSIGMTALDITTNELIVYGVESNEFNRTYALNEVYRFLQSTNPKELIITIGDCDLDVEVEDKNFKEYIESELAIHRYTTGVHNIRQVKKAFTTRDYQNELLFKVYRDITKGYQDPTEPLQLCDKPDILVSLSQALEYIYEVDPNVLIHLTQPKIWDCNNHFTLANNAIEQLEIYFSNGNSGKKSLFDLINNTTTFMGKRLLLNDLVNPIISTEQLIRRWDCVELLKTQGRYSIIEKCLTGMCDISKLYRRLYMQRLYPAELSHLHSTHTLISKLYIELQKHEEWGKGLCIPDEQITQLEKFITEMENTFELNILQNYRFDDIDRNIFAKGKYPEIDEIQLKIDSANTSLTNIQDTLCNLFNLPSGKCKNPPITVMNANRKTKVRPLSFKISLARFKMIEEYLKRIKLSMERQERLVFLNDGLKKNKKTHIPLPGIYRWASYDAYIKWTKCKSDENDPVKILEDGFDGDNFNLLNQSEYLSQSEVNALKSIVNIRHDKSNVSFECNGISQDSDAKVKYIIKINSMVQKQYALCLKDIDARYRNLFDVLNKHVARIDVITSHAKTATKFAYTRPIIVTGDDSSSDNDSHNSSMEEEAKDAKDTKDTKDANEKNSYITAKGLRHPIVEQINKKHKYIPNDIEIGKDDSKGLILYGSNDCGKTTLMKSIGLNILLAQCGSFVAAKSFEFYPFNNILTRLSGNDNMYKGQGSFAVEASELRDITQRCSSKSLVLGDELCRGTEQTTAIGIVTGGILYMNEKDSNFILATHLHTLPNLEDIKNLSHRVQIKHLQVKRDPVTNTLEYVRKICDGPGDANYGIAVGRSQGLPEEILIVAERIRKELMDECEKLASTNRSHFNQRKFVSEFCEICCVRRSEHIHHIYEQNTADDNGIIDNEFHKNVEHNLVSLCRQCHDDIHIRKTLIVEGYVKTSDGVKLKWERKLPVVIKDSSPDDTNTNTSSVEPPLKKFKKILEKGAYKDPFAKY